MSEERNVAILKGAYRRWAESKGGDLTCWLDIVADDVKLQSLAGGTEPMSFTAPRNGRAEIEEYLKGLIAEWEMISYDVHEYVAQRDRVVALAHVAWRNRNTGKVADTPKADVWRFKNGRAADFFELYDTAKTFACARG